MLSSAWNSLTGRKHSREEKKDHADEKTASSVSQPAAAATAEPVDSGSAQRKKLAPEVSSSSSSVFPSTEPLHIDGSSQPHAPPTYNSQHAPAHSTSSAIDQPLHAPPSYAEAVAPLYPVASAPAPSSVSSSSSLPSSSLSSASSSRTPSMSIAAPVPVVSSNVLPEEGKTVLYSSVPASVGGAAGAGALAVAVPVMVVPPRMSQRLLDQAARRWSELQSNPHFLAGHQKAVALVDKHVPPDMRAFIREPTVGKLLRHPTLLFAIYQLYASVRAPFVGLFKVILLNAARRALGRKSATKDADAARLNEDVNAGLKDAIGRDFNLNLSPAVCSAIVANIDREDLQRLFGWFTTTKLSDR